MFNLFVTHMSPLSGNMHMKHNDHESFCEKLNKVITDSIVWFGSRVYFLDNEAIIIYGR